MNPPAVPPTVPSDRARPHHGRLLFGLTVVALLLRLPLLGRPVWFDEACVSDQRLGTFAQLLAVLYVDSNPPLFATFMHLWNGLFGDAELALRTPALLSGLACIPLTFWTGRRLVGDAAALWATALLALSPVHVWYSAEAQLYAPMMACTLFAFGSFDRLLAPDAAPHGRWLWPAHLLNVAVMLGLHYYLAAVVVVLAMAAPLAARGFTRRAMSIVLWHGVGILVLSLLVYLETRIGEPEAPQQYVRSLNGAGLFHFVFRWCWTGDTVPTTTAIADAVAGALASLGVLLAAAGSLTLWRRRDRHRNGWLVLVGLLVLPAYLLLRDAAGRGDTFAERSVVPALPFLMLLVGAGISAFGRRQRVVGGIAVAAVATTLAALFVNGDEHWTVYRPKPDWRSAARYLGAEIDAGGAGRPVFTSTPSPRALSYYDARIQDVKSLRAPTSPAQLGAKVGMRLGGWLGGFAERTFAELVQHNDTLLREARLRIYHSRPTPQALELPDDRPDDICYLVRDHWHPHVSVDGSIEALLASPQVVVLETKPFTGMTVHKVRIAR